MMRPIARCILLTDTGTVAYTAESATYDGTASGGALPPAPTFSAAASITHDGTPQVGEPLTGSDGTVANGTVSARQWLVGGSVVASGATYTPVQTGLVTYRVTASGAGGSAQSSAAVTVGAATAPAPSFTVSPSIGSDGTPQVGEQLTGSDGTVANGTVSARQWLVGGSVVASGATYTPVQTGLVTYRVTASGAGGSAQSSAAVTVGAATAPAPSFTVSPSIASDGTPQVGEQLTGSDGTIANGSVDARRWLRAGIEVGTGSTHTPTQTGTYTFEVTAKGAGGTSTASASVTVAAAPTSPVPAFAFTGPATIAEGTPAPSTPQFAFNGPATIAEGN